ncbi:MAG TPA: presqualene diphosphate synthase HpnD, partial [Burkholderiales bacterium]
WRAEVANLFAGRPQHPVTRALEPHREAFGIAAERLNEIIDGMEMDLRQTRYLDWAGLERYCYRVASVVGLLAAGIFGYRDARTLDYAKNLGIAFQLTNIIRHVGEDARKNRVYLPVEDLQRFGVPAADILQAKETPAFRTLMEFEAERARGYYQSAMSALPAADRRAQRPGLIMAAIYRTLLDEIQREGFHVLTRRTSLTPLRKFWIAWRTWVAA